MRSRAFNNVACLAFIASAVLLPSSARAQVTVYTDFASFVGATSGAATDTFNDLQFRDYNSPLLRTAGSYGYTASAPNGLFVVGPSGDPYLSVDTATDPLTLYGFGSTIRGIGGNFFATDFDGGFVAQTVTLVLNDGLPFFYQVTNPSLTSFLGFVTTSTILSFSVQAQQQADDFYFPTVNNLTLAQGPTQNVVPEPTTVLLMATGLFGIAIVARRRA